MRTTGPLLKVFGALLDHGDEMYGLELLRATNLASGTLYPLLDRMVEQGWATGRWEEADNPAGPRRRYYRLTPSGVQEGRARQLEHGIGASPAWT